MCFNYIVQVLGAGRSPAILPSNFFVVVRSTITKKLPFPLLLSILLAKSPL
jgi:hypothetical protein